MRVHRKPIDKLMDCQTTKRWTLCNTTLDSNVASHSFNVAVIAMAIFKEMFHKEGHSERDVCYYAMLHDVDEAETGDIPTPTKLALKNSGVDPSKVLFTQGLLPEPPEFIAELVKIADLLENYVFISEFGVGTRARVATFDTSRRLTDAIDGSSRKDMARAAMAVLDYIKGRYSDTDQERKRIEEDSERMRKTDEFMRTTTAPNVG